MRCISHVLMRYISYVLISFISHQICSLPSVPKTNLTKPGLCLGDVCLQLKALLPFVIADSGSVPSPGLWQRAPSLHCNQLVKGSLFLFYLPRNVCHSLETEGGQKELCIPIRAATQRLCAGNPEHGKMEMLSVINLPSPYPTASTEADLYILNFN